MDRKKLVSGIRSTGELHLGNYYGAMRGLVNLQNQYESYYFIADIHSLTTHQEPKHLKNRVYEVAKNYLAAGLDPKKSIFYIQSSIAGEIAELHTYLSMIMPLGELLRCPTFKEKAKKHPDNINYGLVGYPVLMAADILIHHGNIVPVGEDQLVHLEIARTIVRKFNQLYGDYFSEPQALKDNAVRIPSLDGKGKMSKSDLGDTYIKMDDSKEIVQQKIKKAYSDPTRIYKNDKGNPTKEGCNVYHLHAYFTEQETLGEIERKCKDAEIGCVDCKGILAKHLMEIIEPFHEKKRKLTNDDVHQVLLEGQKKAKASAEIVIRDVRDLIGLRMI